MEASSHEKAARMDIACFPLTVKWESRWEHPHLFDPGSVVRWFAARVEAFDTNTLYLYGAFSDQTDELMTLEMPFDEAIKWIDWTTIKLESIAEGRYLEIAWADIETAPTIRFHHDRLITNADADKIKTQGL